MKREINSLGQWYLRPDTQELFQVVDCDEQSGAVRIQMFDGSLDEIDGDDWRALSAEPVEAPEDWTGPLDNLEIDDLDEFGAEAEALTEDCVSDDREPWESLLAAEAMGMDSELAAFIGEAGRSAHGRGN